MRFTDVWIVMLVLTVLMACIPLKSTPYECLVVDPRSGAAIEPKSDGAQPNLGSPSPSPSPNACEIENSQLKDELHDWQHRYYEKAAQDEAI